MDLPLPARPETGIVGTGRVGAVLGAALARTGSRVVAASAVSAASRARAAVLLPGVPLRPADDVARSCGLLLLAVPDDALPALVAGLADTGALRPGQLVVHTSGRHGLSVLEPAARVGALPLALHPVLPFSGTPDDLVRLPGAAFGVTAPAALQPVADALVRQVGGEPVRVEEALRPLWHAALGAGRRPAGGAVMQVAVTREELEAARKVLPGRVAVVMTMGALHDGHAALLREARQLADSVVVTIFVNPLQFGAGEDLDRYPRTLPADLSVCAREGVDVVFAPTPDVVYPAPPRVRVRAGPLGEAFEGASRPGHFDGVLTVVLKLLHLVRPDVALFGDKDAQQLACIRAMVRDLDVGVAVVGVPTVRESDGLALSSRNRFLSARERRVARLLSRALATALAADDAAAGRAALEAEPGVDLDYLERVRSTDFAVDPAGDLLVVAARVGTTRLIDNVRVS